MITRELIIKTALRLYLRHGVKTVTVDRLVKELHTSKRTIYNHFENKTLLLQACLSVYHKKVKAENEGIINRSENAIEAMAYLYHRIIERANTVNPNFFNDILHYYPGLLHASYRREGNFALRQLHDLAEWGIRDGIFVADLDIDVSVKTVLSLLKLLKDINLFPIAKYSKERLTFGIMLPYMKGVCTSRGLKILKKQEELFRVQI
ncbi:MAG: TetR/AcrR family transcriptional regulator [Bacteroidota bacterium]